MTVQQGSQGADVRRLQILLNDKLIPRPHLRVDGDFGARTHAAVLAFQAQERLKVDGVVGERTWAALGQKAPTNAELRASHETAVRLDDTDLDEVELAKFQAIIDRFKEEE